MMLDKYLHNIIDVKKFLINTKQNEIQLTGKGSNGDSPLEKENETNNVRKNSNLLTSETDKNKEL